MFLDKKDVEIQNPEKTKLWLLSSLLHDCGQYCICCTFSCETCEFIELMNMVQ